MDSLSYLSVANFDCAQKEVHATRKSTVHDERDQSTAKDEKWEVLTCEEIEREAENGKVEKGETKEKEVKEKDALKIFKLLEITVPDGTIRDSYIAVFPIFLELLYTDNMSASPEFNMSDVIWSAIIFPNGIDKNNPSFVDLAIQIKTYKILYQNSTDESDTTRPELLDRYIVFTVSILKDCEEFFKRETEPFYLTPRDQSYDGYMITLQNFGDKKILGSLADEHGLIKFRVEMEIKRELSEKEKTLQFYYWIHVRWLECEGKQEDWQRVLDALTEEQRRMAESYRVIAALNKLQVKNMDNQIELYKELVKGKF